MDRNATLDLRFTTKNKDIIYHEKLTGKIMYVLTAGNFREKYTDSEDKSARMRFLNSYDHFVSTKSSNDGT